MGKQLEIVGTCPCQACSSTTTVTRNKRGLYTLHCPDCQGYYHSHKYSVRVLKKSLDSGTAYLVGITEDDLNNEYDLCILQRLPHAGRIAPHNETLQERRLRKDSSSQLFSNKEEPQHGHTQD